MLSDPPKMDQELIFGVSDFVAVFNQTINHVYPRVVIQGELANFRVNKDRWVYFDLKDENSSVKFFGTVYNLPGPLTEGMILRVAGSPGLHPLYGFSVTVQSIQLAGEGTIKKAAQLLAAKLEKEGLFDPSRKRALPYPPQSVGLIASGESAAYADFVKILKARWGGVVVKHYDVQVQGEDSPTQVIRAIEHFNSHAANVDVLVITRGGGSTDDLQAFSAESVTRAVAGSRIPTLVAIGHEVDLSLAELAADQRASTPSNAAELLVPDKKTEVKAVQDIMIQAGHYLSQSIQQAKLVVDETHKDLTNRLENLFTQEVSYLQAQQNTLMLASPQNILNRGYAIVRKNGKTIRSVKLLSQKDSVDIQLSDGHLGAEIIKRV